MKEEYPPQIPELNTLANEDEYFMREALKEAWKAFFAEEVPIGAVIVKNGQIIARGHNQVEMLQDATAHAELLSITAAESAVCNWRLLETKLYSTIEPCAMCAGAILLARIPELIWGAQDLRHGANGSWVNLFRMQHPTHTVKITSSVLEEWCQIPLKLFFQKRRKENKESWL